MSDPSPSGWTRIGQLFGVGLGPGASDLVTLRAVQLIQKSPVIAYFMKRGGCGRGRQIVAPWIDSEKLELPLVFPVTTEIAHDEPLYAELLSRFYDESVRAIANHLEAGRDVAVLCEGDPLFYGSFMHLFVRMKARCRIAICPGITGMSACWTAAEAPIAWGEDVLTVLPATMARGKLVDRLRATDAAVVMKIGRHLAKIRAALDEVGLLDRAIYVERAATPDQTVVALRDKSDDEAPYFSMVLVAGRGWRA